MSCGEHVILFIDWSIAVFVDDKQDVTLLLLCKVVVVIDTQTLIKKEDNRNQTSLNHIE
jgi:hypothetical protein